MAESTERVLAQDGAGHITILDAEDFYLPAQDHLRQYQGPADEMYMRALIRIWDHADARAEASAAPEQEA